MPEYRKLLGLLVVGTCEVWGSPVAPGDDAKKAETKVDLVLGQWQPGEPGGRQALAEGVPLVSPFGVDFLPDGTMVIVELEGGRVHTLEPSGRFATVSGDGSKGYAGDGGPAAQATFNGMHNLAITPEGMILIADTWNHAVRRLTGRQRGSAPLPAQVRPDSAAMADRRRRPLSTTSCASHSTRRRRRSTWLTSRI